MAVSYVKCDELVAVGDVTQRAESALLKQVWRIEGFPL